ncbi:MAG TPA: DUF3841 domain-containing protein [Candidatus Dormibacteraeota bacterium]|nr:DUF3841 domain-containing protein [Candidatus Dormibacteraeota bacterium]
MSITIPKEGPVTLWTIHEQEFWELCQQRGVILGDGRRIFDRYFLPQYQWIKEQMKLRIPEYTGRYPVWAWFTPKPDLRGTNYLLKGQRGVRVEFTAPAEQVLLSDFNAWHIVMNFGYMSHTEEEYERFEAEYPNHHKALQQPEYIERLKESWVRIFDLDSQRDPEWAGEPDYIQACVEKVSLEQVVRVTPFTAR